MSEPTGPNEAPDFSGGFHRQAFEENRAVQTISLLQSTLESTADGILVIDRAGKIVLFNQRFTQMWQIPPEVLDTRDDAKAIAFVLDQLRDPEQFSAKVKELYAQPDTPSFDVLEFNDGRVFERYSLPQRLDGQPVGRVWSFRDVTDRRRAEEALRQSEEKHREILGSISEGYYEVNLRGDFTFANDALCVFLGYPREELLGMNNRQYTDPENAQKLFQGFHSVYLTGSPASFLDWEILRKDGTRRIVEASVALIRSPAGEPQGFRGVVRDVTERKRADQLRSALYRIAETTGSMEDMDAFYAAMHATVGELMDAKNFYIALQDEPAQALSFPYFVDEIDPVPPKVKPGRTLTEYVLRTGRPLLASPAVFAQLVESGEVESVGAPSVDWLGVPLKRGERSFGVLVVQSYTESLRFTEADRDLLTFVSQHVAAAIDRKKAEEQIRSLAYHDALTGLPNRLLFQDRLSMAVANAHRRRHKLAVLFFDLDRFKLINDSLGHSLGDRLLQAVAQRLEGSVREGDTVARLGGDEFTVLLPELGRSSDAAKVAGKILEALKQPLHFEERELYITASVGIAIYPHDGKDAETLVKNADTAMYRAKEQGRDNYQLYTATMNASAVERLALESALRKAVADRRFEVHYQPQLDFRADRVYGVEALVRWRHPERGLVPPSEFIGVAEVTGLIVPLGLWVLETACAQVKSWQERGHPELRVGVNLSARQLQAADVVQQVQRVLRETGLAPQSLDLEITETSAMQNAEATIATLRELKAVGVSISIDDFGIGYSSLNYLKRLPVDTLKIDRSFVRDVTTDADDAAIATAIIALAHTLKLTVVAEGVESREQLAFLASRGCQRMQGHLFSGALPAEACEAFLARQRQTDRPTGRSETTIPGD